MANIFETKFNLAVGCETIDGVKTPRIDKPNFTLGDLDFELSCRPVFGGDDDLHWMCLGLSEASKKSLFDGFSINIEKFTVTYDKTREDKERESYGAKQIIVKSPLAIFGFRSPFVCELNIALKFDDVYPYRLDFVKEGVASRNMNCNASFILDDDENKEVYVNRELLAMNSRSKNLFFFDGCLDFEDDHVYQDYLRDENEFHLRDVKEADFLDYLARVYTPVRPLALKRVETLLVLADRFENVTLKSEIEAFLFEQTPSNVKEKLQMLNWSGIFHMPRLFLATLKTMDKTDMKQFDPKVSGRFKPDVVPLLTARMIELL